jgi:hypothetical protein
MSTHRQMDRDRHFNMHTEWLQMHLKYAKAIQITKIILHWRQMTSTHNNDQQQGTVKTYFCYSVVHPLQLYLSPVLCIHKKPWNKYLHKHGIVSTFEVHGLVLCKIQYLHSNGILLLWILWATDQVFGISGLINWKNFSFWGFYFILCLTNNGWHYSTNLTLYCSCLMGIENRD